jgi:WD40 repeat protein
MSGLSHAAGEIRGLAITSDGRFACTGASDMTAIVWDVNRQEEIASFTADYALSSLRYYCRRKPSLSWSCFWSRALPAICGSA